MFFFTATDDEIDNNPLGLRTSTSSWSQLFYFKSRMNVIGRLFAYVVQKLRGPAYRSCPCNVDIQADLVLYTRLVYAIPNYMAPSRKGKTSGVSASSFLDLQAEIAKHEAEFSKNKAAGQTALVGGVKRPDKVRNNTR